MSLEAIRDLCEKAMDKVMEREGVYRDIWEEIPLNTLKHIIILKAFRLLSIGKYEKFVDELIDLVAYCGMLKKRMELHLEGDKNEEN
jgi:hypothetical protein